jgi:excisionase family DNA binding protein
MTIEELQSQTGENEYVTVDEFAKIISCPPATVRQMIREGAIPAFHIRPAGRKYIIDVRKAINAMEQNTVKGAYKYANRLDA